MCTVEDECVFLPDADCDDALPNIDPPAFLSIFEAAAPSGEVIALCRRQVLLG